MAGKPKDSGEGSGGSKGDSSLKKSWELAYDGQGSFNDGYWSMVNQASDTGPTGNNLAKTLGKSNDFVYLGSSVDTSGDFTYTGADLSPLDERDPDDDETDALGVINGGGGADQLLFLQDGINIRDSFFGVENFLSFEVVKLADGAAGSTIALDDEAFATGIREVTGGSGNDTITFTDTSNSPDPDTGYDTVDVKATGGDGEDVIIAAGGNDTLEGGDGNDTLDGGAGGDTLLGGAGDDSLTGDGGADIFVFQSTSDGADTVEDFDHDDDTIDLSAIAGVVTVVTDGTPTANAVWWTEGGSNTTVELDVDGNAVADYSITLVGTGLGLDASDFILA